MSDRTIRELAERLASVERQLHANATAPKITHTSVRDGFLRFQPPDGTSENPKVYLGGDATRDAVGVWVSDKDGFDDISFGADFGGDDFFAIYNPAHDGYVLAIFNGQLHAPLIGTAWQRDGNRTVDGNGRAVTNSGTYTAMAATWLPCTSGAITTQIDVIIGAGVTSADVRVLGRQFGGIQAPVVIHETTGITASVVLGGAAWAVPDTTGSPPGEPIGHVLELFAEARVAGGAGDVAVLGRQPVINWPA